MSKITYDSDEQLTAPVYVNQMRDVALEITPNKIRLKVDFEYQPKDVDGNPVGDPVLVRQEAFDIIGQHFTDLASAVVGPQHVGRRFFALLRNAVRQKAKIVKGIQGTVEDDE